MIKARGAVLPATLDLPAGPIRGGLSLLHGAEAGHRSFLLYEHLARILPPTGIAVLRHERRPTERGRRDVPFSVQSADAMAAMSALRGHIGDVPVGLWGFSQGAWVAALTAATQPADVALLILVSSCGVSPAQQMRIGCDRQVTAHGYDQPEREELALLRSAYEDYLRGSRDRASAQALVDVAADQPWFPLSFVPRVMPDQGTWTDMDFAPEPVFAGVTCPVLAFYGETDAWMPIDESVAAWHRASRVSCNQDVSVVRLSGCDHAPTLPGGDRVSEPYSREMRDWLDAHLPWN